MVFFSVGRVDGVRGCSWILLEGFPSGAGSIYRRVDRSCGTELEKAV